MTRQSFKTKKGTELPLVSLKGKEYLLVAHRLVWLVEEADSYSIETEFLKLEEEYSIARTKLVIYDKDGKVIKQASATKKETKKDFPDFVEKSETGSLGRALSMCGFGTQFSLPDLDEGERLADAPLAPPPIAAQKAPEMSKPKVATFRKPKTEESGGWE
jgi:hypothetical protein